MNIGELLRRCKRTETGCLIFKGAVMYSGKKRQLSYPHLWLYNKRGRGNRLVYEYFNGEECGRNHVLHSCDNSMCLNPKHLRIGTHKENMQDKINRNRDHNKTKTHCKNGHEFSGDNLILRRDGARGCRQCMRKYWSKFDKLNREERRVKALERYYRSKGGMCDEKPNS